MRTIPFLFCLLFLVGCAADSAENRKFNVSFSDAFNDDVFIPEENRTLDRISFVMSNNELFDLNCTIMTSIKNSTNSSYTKGVVGVLHPKDQKNVSLNLEMLHGESNISITPQCVKI